MAKKIIGRTDKADFKEFKLKNIDIKIDTGAYTSSIHCHDIHEEIINGKKVIEFDLLDPSHKLYNNKQFRSSNFTRKNVKNSFGVSEKRYVIKTEIFLFDTSYPIELTLSERGEMKYPVLIGRRLLTGKFIVDTDKKNLSYIMKKNGKKK